MDNIKAWIEDLPNKRVLIIGDVMIDRYLLGKVNRISPEAPVPIVDLNAQDDRLGGAANVALNIQAMGAQALLCGILGEDDEGQRFQEILRAHGLSNEAMMAFSDRRTTVKSRVIAGRQHLLRIDQENRHELSAEQEERLIHLIVLKLETIQIDLILFQDYNKGMLTERVISSVIKEAKARHIPTVVDPKEQNFFAFKGVTLFKPNLREIQQALGDSFAPDLTSLQKANQHLKRRLSNQKTLITLSENGLFFDDGAHSRVYPTMARTIVDVCGAGDTVVSVAALALLGNLSSEELATIANLAGGQVCEQIGVVTVNMEQLAKEYEGH